ncbi:MAG: DNA helicase PcrA [Tissierellia bacterium]|nr:DNA helicase PcrA [Tissierellia bacterium]
MTILDNLNKEQRQGVLETEGPVLILAGAGSGKTRVVTSKIAYLIEEKGVLASSILAITFTNKAANEMKERVGQLLDINVDPLWIGTFHATCVRILRRHIERLGYDRNFTIYDSADQLTLVKESLKDQGLNKDMFKERAVRAQISSWKNQGTSPKEALKENEGDLYLEKIAQVYGLYEKRAKENNALDFDDLLIRTVELFRDHQEVLTYYQNKFKYIFVDEYQDTNHIQYLFIRYLAGKTPNLTVVGDNDQSIYKWRGADIANIMNFEKDYPQAQVILLEQNYRSTQPILETANQLISYNTDRKDKRLWTDKKEGKAVSYREYNHNTEEEIGVVDKIRQGVKEGRDYKDFAILYRTNAQSRGFEDVLLRKRVPYKIVGGTRFYERKEVKDILAYLQLVQNPADDIALRRIINSPKRGIGTGTMDQINDYASQEGLTLMEVVDTIGTNQLKIRAKKNVEAFGHLMGLLRAKAQDLSLSDLVEATIFDSQYAEDLKREDTVESRTRLENIQELISVALQYEKENPEAGLEEFLASLSLISDIDQVEDKENSVTLMTMHGAKGLEFPVVFVVGMEEKLFPTHRSLDSTEDMEEERRLCYVAVTRAEEELYLSSAKSRTLFGQTNVNLPSRFLQEMGSTIEADRSETIESSTVDSVGRSITAKGSTERQMARKRRYDEIQEERIHNQEASLAQVKLGTKVEHKKWGQGMVVQIKGEGADEEVVISFPDKGLKTLRLSLAPIKIL